MENKRYPKLCDDKSCTGCSACVNSCHAGALTISMSSEGFYRPSLNTDKCIRCYACERNCPVLNPPQRNNAEDIKVYAAWNLDEEVRLKSSSGGAFTALADTILTKGGVVFGAAWGNDMIIEHVAVTEKKDLSKLRLSKYAQSNIGNTFKKVKEYLAQDRHVLFVGTPCQVMGLKRYLGKDYDKLAMVDFVCHGVPSIKFLQVYSKWLEDKVGKVVKINFRDKRKGWYDNLRVVTNERGNEKAMLGKNDCYWVAFNNNNNLQECCYNCVAQGFPRASDMTIADFWGIGKQVPFGHKDEIEKGISLIVVNNNKGKKLLNNTQGGVFLEERTVEEAIGGNMTSVRSSKRPSSRDTIYCDIDKMSFEDYQVKYMSTTFKQDIVKFFRERMPYSFIKFVRLMSQK